MPSQEKQQLDTLIEEQKDIFCEQSTQTTIYEHTVSAIDPAKIVKQTYPIPMKYEKEVDTGVQRMLTNDIIERSNGDFLNALIDMSENDGGIRLLDMRELNSLILKEYDCTTTTDELFTRCQGMKYITNSALQFLADSNQNVGQEIYCLPVQK